MAPACLLLSLLFVTVGDCAEYPFYVASQLPYMHYLGLIPPQPTFEEADGPYEGAVSPTSRVDDRPFHRVRLSFAFPFHDRLYSEVFISANGFISFLPEPSCRGFCQEQYTDFIAPLMDDFDPSGSPPAAAVLFRHDTREQSFAVQWTRLVLYNTSGPEYTFGAVLHNNGTVVLYYQDLPLAVSALCDRSCVAGVSELSPDRTLSSSATTSQRTATTGRVFRGPDQPHLHTLLVSKMVGPGNSSIILEPVPNCEYIDNCLDCLSLEMCSWCPSRAMCTNGEISLDLKNWCEGDVWVSRACPLENLMEVVGKVVAAMTAVVVGGGMALWYRHAGADGFVHHIHAFDVGLDDASSSTTDLPL